MQILIKATYITQKLIQYYYKNKLQQIASYSDELYLAFENEKYYLMSEILYSWADRQQKVSIGTLWSQQKHYRLLDTIHQQFDYFGELLEHTLAGLQYLREKFDHEAFDLLYSKFQQFAHYFLYYSIIVSRQPPSVVIKCGDAENHRRSRFWFNTEIRILGGRAFGLDVHGRDSEVQCFLITDDTARQLLTNAYYNVFDNEEFLIEPTTAIFALKNEQGLKAKFDDMRVSKKGQLRRDSVATKRYCLCYNIQMQASHGITLVGKKVSLPFAILVGPKSDVEARLFLERSFADLVKRPLSEMPQSVHFSKMAEALEMKFQAIVETAQKPTDEPLIIQPRMFTSKEKEHIILRLKPTADGQIVLENFLKLAVCQEYTTKRASSEGEWKLVAFFDWFFKIAEIINKYLYQMWTDGLIYGFCGKDEAENLLRMCSRSCLLIRFSDVEYGKIKISVRYRNGGLYTYFFKYSFISSET
ncbi:unnamed protein product [Thelazia callipaeda]|uniref:STAT_bind domain-containing protein n=1 Tax=Thelazia callipaeda TaxID=103827 RepID=A0A0N5D9K6_THECL|nr:unnamed protein product [Thelazia callipaeda]